MLITKMYIKCVYGMGSIQRLRLESCMLGEECVILLFQKEYAGLRVNLLSYFLKVKHTCILISTQLSRPMLAKYHLIHNELRIK